MNFNFESTSKISDTNKMEQKQEIVVKKKRRVLPENIEYYKETFNCSDSDLEIMDPLEAALLRAEMMLSTVKAETELCRK